MPEIIGITDLALHVPTKRDALLFDRLGVIGYARTLPTLEPHIAADLEWLVELGIILPVPDSMGVPPTLQGDLETLVAQVALDIATTSAGFRDYVGGDATYKLARQLAVEATKGYTIELDALVAIAHEVILLHLKTSTSASLTTVREAARRALVTVKEHAVRSFSHHLRSTGLFDATSLVFNIASPLPPDVVQPPDPVLQVVLDALPLPDDETPWEQILDFRNDADARMSLRRLRVWMRQIAAMHGRDTDSDAGALIDELEYLLSDYESYVRLHRLKFERGTLETTLVTTAELIESVMRLQLGRAARKLFSFKEQQIELLEAERNAPGREVAYIAKARKVFQRDRLGGK